MGAYLAGPKGLMHALLSPFAGMTAQTIKLVNDNFYAAAAQVAANATPAFRCIVPSLPADFTARYAGASSQCINLEEGLSVLAQVSVHLFSLLLLHHACSQVHQSWPTFVPTTISPSLPLLILVCMGKALPLMLVCMGNAPPLMLVRLFIWRAFRCWRSFRSWSSFLSFSPCLLYCLSLFSLFGVWGLGFVLPFLVLSRAFLLAFCIAFPRSLEGPSTCLV